MAQSLRKAVVLALVFVGHSHPCDSEHGTHCPAEGLDTLGGCLSSHSSELSADCKEWVGLHEACSKDLDTFCSGMAYTNDAHLCITQWTQPHDLSDECKAALPAEEEVEKEDVDDEDVAQEKKRKNRRKGRAEEVRDYHKMKEKEAREANEKAKAKKRKGKKNKKKKKKEL